LRAWVGRALWRSIKLAGMFVYASAELVLKRPSTRHARADWLHRFAARAVRRLRVPVRVHGRFPEHGVVISNHLSYLDIVVYAALHPCVFVSKAENERLPVLGWMTTMSGAVYVERGRGISAIRAGAAMQAAAADGLPVLFFPEGTTGNGTCVMKFHSGLLAQAMGPGLPITAAYIRYRLIEDNGPCITVEEDVCWGDRAMLPHIFRFLGLRGVDVEVRFADAPIAFSSDTLHRKAAAIEARAAVVALTQPVEDTDTAQSQSTTAESPSPPPPAASLPADSAPSKHAAAHRP
jgi:lyso-ornithine lipid O-acyltransferase